MSKAPLELAFDSIVLAAGGHFTSELHPYQQFRARGDPPKDADYFFPAHTTVAELKRLEQDTFAFVDDPRFEEMGHDWVRRGLISMPRSKRLKWSLPELPVACQREVMSLLKGPIENLIKDANKQIKATKATLGLSDDARGLLLLASDGNRVLDPLTIFCVLARVYKRPHFSAIHSIAYFTFGQMADAPSINSDVTVWVDTRVQGEGVPRALLSDLHDRLSKALEAKFGQTIQRVDGERILADLKFPPKKTK